MSANTLTSTVQQGLATLHLRPESPPAHTKETNGPPKRSAEEQKKRDAADAKYGVYLPTFDDIKYPPLTAFKHEDPGLKALTHEDPRSFLKNATLVDDLSPNFGTEVRGVSLVNLDDVGRQQLALLVAQRGVVVRRFFQCWSHLFSSPLTIFVFPFNSLGIPRSRRLP